MFGKDGITPATSHWSWMEVFHQSMFVRTHFKLLHTVHQLHDTSFCSRQCFRVKHRGHSSRFENSSTEERHCGLMVRAKSEQSFQCAFTKALSPRNTHSYSGNCSLRRAPRQSRPSIIPLGQKTLHTSKNGGNLFDVTRCNTLHH